MQPGLKEKPEVGSQDLKESIPLLATPGRFRNRTSETEVVPLALPPPPARPPPLHPSKCQTASPEISAPALCMRWPLEA